MVRTKRPNDSPQEQRLGTTKFIQVSLNRLRQYDAVDKHNMRVKLNDGFTYMVVNRYSIVVGNIDTVNQMFNWFNIATG